MKIAAFLLTATAAVAAYAAPSPQASSTPVPDKPAVPGTTLNNAYWLLNVNSARKAINDIPAIKVSNATLGKEATAWSGRCIWQRDPDVANLQTQALAYWNGSATETSLQVVQAATAAIWGADQLGCGATYCTDFSVDEATPFGPPADTKIGWFANCYLHYQ
ncbi:hypothetical protein JCM10449v2_005870 [Rhodotorula kratochvilovae]